MNLTISYVIISSGEDIYIEQALMSIWSCRRFNPDIKITVVTDGPTAKLICLYPEIEQLVDEIKVIELDKNFSNFERSRILKTRLREYIDGDLLFVDTDTIFCDKIDLSDLNADNIAIVEDIHIESLKSHPFKSVVERTLKSLFDSEIKGDLPYFNSGVIFYRDTEEAHLFAEKWYKNWESGKNKDFQLGKFDQTSLLKTLYDNPGVVKPLNGNYNVQILGGIKYLASGKILHFFNANWGRDSVHPFLNKDYYRKIKSTHSLSEENKEDVLKCKTLFSSPTFIIGSADVPFWISPEISRLRLLLDTPFWGSMTKIILRGLNGLARIHKRFGKS